MSKQVCYLQLYCTVKKPQKLATKAWTTGMPRNFALCLTTDRPGLRVGSHATQSTDQHALGMSLDHLVMYLLPQHDISVLLFMAEGKGSQACYVRHLMSENINAML